MDDTNLWLGPARGTRVVAFSPADARSRVRLEELHASLTRDAAAA
jgi:hypothetical protein